MEKVHKYRNGGYKANWHIMVNKSGKATMVNKSGQTRLWGTQSMVKIDGGYLVGQRF